MLGQDMMKINEAEFKLQSLVSPEFHEGIHALHRAGRVYGGMEVNTMSPEQVDFVQATSQWPKFSDPGHRNAEMTKTIYPENPVLFPHHSRPRPNNDNTLVPMGNTLKSSKYTLKQNKYSLQI